MLDAYGEKLEKHFILLLFVTSSPIFQIITGATDSISSGQVLRDGETMASSDGKFEMGFFSPGKSKNRYLGMWFKNIADRRIVWVANREIPITSSTGALKLMESGLLVLLNDTNGIIIWSSNMSRSVENPIAQLLDSGNLVMRDASDERPENYLWQSFDHPTDTYIAGMKCGWNLAEGLETYILSWRSEDDPTPGEFTINLDPTGYPQVVLKRGQSIRQRAGPWNGLAFSGILHSREDPRFNLTLVENQNEVYFLRSVSDNSIPTIDWLSPSGIDQRWTWVNKTQEWVLFYNLPADNCDNYRLCGANGICGMENFVSCGCLDGFVPKDEQSWNKGDWLNGCVRTTNLSCQGDFFLKQSGIKMPDARNSSFNKSTTLEECKLECLRNCLCTAYTQLDIRNGGSGCLLYFGDLIDIRKLYKDGQDLYIRIAASDLGFEDDAVSNKGRKRVQLITSITLAGGVVLLGLSLILYVVKRKKIAKMRAKGSYLVSHAKDPELPLFKLSTILKATDNFSINNKLGEGGFGPVYKGVLEEGQEIAVKRLSETSMQGVEEFKNEAVLIAKLQHRNLVRLLGCCIQGEEIMLIYEYLPNKSLDLFLFDQTKCQLLDWAKRFHIINGIARGLMYLHHDSRLRIIHRDLKTSNILLDSDMNAKISDFGMARSFRGNEIEAKTHRVVGTYGYMSPEYAVHGLFSQKSDVYSFGVMLLELVSGKRNREYSRDGQNLNLLGYAWTLYKEDRSIELVDASLGTSFHLSEAVRSIHLGLLCVQGRPEDRPTMSSVVFMLRNEIVLPEAKHPGFFMERYDDVCQKSIEIDAKPTNSVNEVSITLPEGR